MKEKSSIGEMISWPDAIGVFFNTLLMAI